MQRREAIILLREIVDFPEIAPCTCVYLKPDPRAGKSGQLELHLKTNCDSSTRQIIEQLARKHCLLTKTEPGGFFVIYSPEKKLVEITA